MNRMAAGAVTCYRELSLCGMRSEVKMRWLLLVKTALTLAIVLVLPLGSAAAGVYTTLHSFCAKSKCKDGASPFTALLAGPDGTLYGTTPPVYSQHLRVWNQGTVFSLSQVRGEWKL